jgi:hypothetical protein
VGYEISNLGEIHLGKALAQQDKEAQIHFFSFLRCNWKSKDKCCGVDFVIPKYWQTNFVALFFQTEGSTLSALMKLI